MREKNPPVTSALVCKYRDQGLHCPGVFCKPRMAENSE